MTIIEQAIQQMLDFEIGLVQSYIRGINKRNWRGARYDELDARSAMESLIRRACHLKESGIELGSLDYGMYLREKKRQAKRVIT